MAVSFRPNHSFSWSLALVLAARFTSGVSAVAPALARQQLTRVQDPNVIFDNINGTTVVYSPVTGQQIPQGLASDGSGSGFSTSAVLWIVFSFVVGAPLLLAGFRGGRLTLGTAIGTAAVLASWAVIVNTLDNVGVSDVVLTLCILVLFAMGFSLGLLEMTRVLGILVLGALGGLAIGVRIVLLRSGLIVSDSDAFFLNWLIIGVCGIAGSILVVWKQKYGILNGCASTGSFLCGLGFDLVVNQQFGMSRGLRYLFDRNSYHVVDTMTNGYSPPMTTVAILAVSLGVTPAFAFAQWKVFTRVFGGAECDTFGGSVWEPQEVPQDEESIPQQSMDMPDTPTAEKPPKLPLSDNAKEGRSS
ncbi:hypothetical protein J3R82DRAFT_1421 [Butyriboletus roseoflavus]|nr:hypothetical protein J3R82DRAFT_1421 [Butyriboletus roseoflavus]